jgi:tight adherence protein B
LRQADLKLKVSEYMLLHVVAVLVFGVISWFLFNQSVVFALIGSLAGFFAPRMYVSQRARKRRRDFENQLGDTLNLWVNALRSGYSVLQSMETIASETPEPISTEFERVVQEVRLGLTMEQALTNLLDRIPSDDLDLVVTAVNIQREVGGNLAEVLAIISHTIRERIRIKGEIRVMTAQATISGYVISGLPIALTLFLRASSPTYINELFVKERPWLVPETIPCGWLVMGAGLMLIFGGFMVMRKIADIEV